MEGFQHSLDSVKAIPGVEGLCILNGRKIALRDLSDPLEDEQLVLLGQELRDLQSALAINKMGTALIYIYFEEKKIFFYPLSENVSIIVFCSEDINPKLIEMHFQVAKNAILDWIGEETSGSEKGRPESPDPAVAEVEEPPSLTADEKTRPQNVNAGSDISPASDKLDQLDPALMHKIQYLFRDLMGPIAGVVWKKGTNKWLNQTEQGDLRELIAIMAKEFHDIEDRETFTRRAEALLKDHDY